MTNTFPLLKSLAPSLAALCLSALLSSACDDEGGASDAGGDVDGGVDGDVDGGVGDADENTETSSWPSGRYITPEEVHERFSTGDPEMLLLNVVDESFYDLGHIEGSILIPWDQLPERLDEVDAGRHIVIYCRLGVRSESAYDTLEGAGYESIWIMEGGITAWIDLGYPTVSQP